MVDRTFKNDLFRLAAVLYADNNYEISSKNVIRKIIESVFIDRNNEACTIHELIEFVVNSYEIQIEEEEITSVITDNKYSHHFDVNYSNESHIRLSESRLQTLQNKIHNKTIDYFINEFVENIQINDRNINYKDLYN